jgi:RND family efflux transporter MFP subunit
VGCGQETEASQLEKVTDTAVPISTYTVTQHTFRHVLEVQANVLANKQAVLMPKVPGEVRKVLVAEGDVVKKGQLLLKLDQKDFRLGVRQARSQLAAARAGVGAAEAGLETINSKYNRLSSLYDKKVISESDYEDIAGGQRATEAQVAMARAQLQLAQVGLEAARNNLEYTEVRAPFDGVVGKRMVDEGAKINIMPPTPVMMIVDLSSVKIEGAVSELDLPLVQVGAQAEILIDALGGQPLVGTVERVEPVVDPMSRTATVRVLLSNDGGELKAGMSARLHINLEQRKSAAVPDDAVLRTDLETSTGNVFVVKDGRVTRHDVTIGARDGDLVEITGDVTPGDIIVREGQEQLVDGQTVVIRDAAKVER